MGKTERLLEQLDEAFERLEDTFFWKHYKGGVYQVTGIVFDTNIDGPAYAYKRIDGPDFNSELEQDVRFTRPVDDWFATLPDGRKRFEPCNLN